MDRNRPLIGLAAYEVPASFSHWRDVECDMVPAGYVKQVVAAGGMPLLVPPVPDVEQLVSVLDGLVLTGGSDIGAERYGEQRHPDTLGVFEHRDSAEVELLQAALAADLPVLGICRGMQLMNVVAGGTLHQHLPEVVESAADHKGPPGVFVRHQVETVPGTRLAGIVGPGGSVHSCHHQSPDRIGEGLVVSASAPDGVVEGLERPDRRFAVGVLWHPEEDLAGGGPLFAALLEAAANHKLRRAA